MATDDYRIKDGQIGVECPNCERNGDPVGSGFDKERVEAWLADPESDEEFEHPQANIYQAIPYHEPCGTQMVVRDEDKEKLEHSTD